MQKWAGMLVETGKAFVDPSVMMTQMREDSDFWSLPPLTTLCWRTHLAITKHPEDGHGISQMDNTTTRLIDYTYTNTHIHTEKHIVKHIHVCASAHAQ